MKKTLIFIGIIFLIFLLFYNRTTISFEGNNWNVEKLIINKVDLVNNRTKIIYPTKIIVNDNIDSLIILNPKFTYKYQLKIEKNKGNKYIAILNSKNLLLNDTLEIKFDTIVDNYYRRKRFDVELKSKKTLISMSRTESTIIIPKQPRKPVKGLP